MRALVLALAVAALPAAAQSTPAAPEAAPPAADSVEVALFDPLLVGEWTLDEVAEGGFLARMNAEVEAMTCDFDADGTATVAMTVLQDQETTETSSAFDYETEAGQILSDTDDPVRYRILEDGRLELSDSLGLVLRLVRADA